MQNDSIWAIIITLAHGALAIGGILHGHLDYQSVDQGP